MRSLGWLALSFVAGCSCGSSHELPADASPPIVDAGTDTLAPPDGGHDAQVSDADAFTPPEAHFFSLEPAEGTVENERCAASDGARTMLRVTVQLSSTCDTPGPIDVVDYFDMAMVLITPHVWHEHGRTDCAAISTSYERDVPVDGLPGGIWSVVSNGTTSSLVVSTMPPITCPAPGTGTVGVNQMCRADCECAPGLSCLAVRGDAACARFCADPCEALGASNDLSLSCATGDACTNDGNLGWICEAATASECPCPAGMTCPPVTEGPPQCVWSIELNSSTRHDCVDESECMPGLDCVQRADGRRACEVRCTTSDMSCPTNAPHACMSGNWVCEWLGE